MGKPIPTSLREVTGNKSHHRSSSKEPRIELGKSEVPPHLAPEEQVLYERISSDLLRYKVLTKLDGSAVEMAVTALSDYYKAREMVDEVGTTYVTPNGMIRPHPSVAHMTESWKRYVSMLKEFGMTPSARTKVEVAGEDKEPALELVSYKRS